MDQDVPPLDDFQDQLKTLQYSKATQNKSDEDYTKMNVRHIEDQREQKQELSGMQAKVKEIQQKIQKQDKKDFGGFKKGFLSGSSQPKKEKIPELKANKNVNPLQFKQVQQSMKVNNYLEETRSQWMTDNFLNNVTSNEKINKLFTNPEYMKAIDLFKTNPRQAMQKYGNNKEFMQGFQEFCKMMGMQFQNLAKNEKK